ncbi:MAG: XrtA/PEP-CTERM system amidotransferase [Gammaproteobacteria bacterium]
MCGLVGMLRLDGQAPIDRALLARMNDSQSHRGPDEQGLHVEPGVGLGHRRLSIIDLAAGQQPLFNEDGSVVVVYNGEIYNFQTLVAELTALGHIFRTHSDTEVIVHAWEQWGEGCVQRFRGMFAFGLWDRNRKTLLLARDRLGVKPLYYAVLPNRQLAFASELKALLKYPDLSTDIDPQAVDDYFAYGYVPEPKTILSSVRKLPPGHTLTARCGAPLPAPRQYWEIPFTPLTRMNEIEAAEELIGKLREAVAIRLVAEVPLGAFLSGGVDSSAVVAMMAGLSERPVNTCSIAFGDAAFDESAHAAQVAARYRTNHRVERVEADDFALVDALATVYDEPFADSSAIPTYRVCELARKQVTVALSGDGGDENLAGYRRYRWHMNEQRVRNVLPQGLRGPLFGWLGRTYPKLDWAPRYLRAKSTLEALSWDAIEGYFHSVSILGDLLRPRLYSTTFRRLLQGYRPVEVLRGHAARAPTEHPLSLIQYLDMKTYLVGDILTKVDRASMAHALEVREPLLDHELIEWLSGLPPNFKLRGREGKYIFKKALESYLPADILYRPKMGFSVPLAAWFRGPLRDEVRDRILGPVMLDSGIFDRRSLTQLIDQHQSKQRDHGAALWSLLMFESFRRNVLGERSATTARAISA